MTYAPAMYAPPRPARIGSMGGLTLVIAPHAFTNDPCPCGHALEESDESEWTCSRGHKFRRWGWLGYDR